MDDLISRQAAIDALWKALYEYEDKTEKQFQESEDLDLKDWFLHRIFVQNMSDIDRQTILNLPSAQPEITKEYNLKKIYNIYVKIAQAHFVYQPSKPKAIAAMPFDWIEAQNLLEKYLKDHGADFDVLYREYVSENVKDDYLPSTKPKKLYTKADYIMALHKEYGCSLTRAEEAHNKALEYLRDNARMKG